MKKQLGVSFCLLVSLGIFGFAVSKNQRAQKTGVLQAAVLAKTPKKECRLSARATKPVFILPESVVFRVFLKNMTDEEIVFYDSYPKGDFRVEGKDASGKVAFRSTYVLERFRNAFHILPAGQIADFTLKLNEFVDLKAGTYFVTVRRTFVKRMGEPQNSVELASNPVRIKLVKASAPKRRRTTPSR